MRVNTMARRAIWSGSISFGLVNIPIKMYTATREHEIRFNMLHDQDHARLRRKLVSETTGKEVHPEHIIKGYEFAKNQYVVVQKDELESCAPEKSKAIDYRGSWERAEHRYYRGDRARQAKRKGATATFRFTGSQVAWNGPNGPTRGKAKVYLDGQYVKTVDLYARKFDARNRIYTKTFADAGAHTLTIKVMGTRGRPVVSIDEFVVWE